MSEPTTGTDTGQTAGRRPGHSPLVAALEAGRLFHRARALACELTLSGRPLTERRLIEEVTPALVAAVGVTAPSSAGWAERELGRWLRELAGRLGGIDHVERLDDQQQALDALTGWEREEYDLGGLRDRLLRDTHDEVDGRHADLLAVLPESEAAAFLLGEVLEAGALPLAHAPHGAVPAIPGPQTEKTVPFGDPAPPDHERGRDLTLAPPPAVPFEVPWPKWWPAWVRARWAACGLPDGDEALPHDPDYPTDPADRRRVVEVLAERAEALLQTLRRPALAVTDRFRVADDGAQELLLDGRHIVVKDRSPYLVVKALLEAQGHRLSKKELHKLPGCKGDISKIIARLPMEIRKVVESRPGPDAFYFILLPSRSVAD